MPSTSGIASQAGSGATNAMNASNVLQGQSGSAYASLLPGYQQLASGNAGFTPQQQNNMLTSSAQSLAGTNANAYGQATLNAARNNSAGGYAAALDDASRNANANQSANAVNVANKNAELEQSNRLAGLNGLNSVYGEANSAGNAYANTGNSYLGTENQALANNPWMKLLQAGIAAGGQVGSAYAGK